MPQSWKSSESWSTVDALPELEWDLARSMADEVAIDFPSMHGPLARMLAGFDDGVDPTPIVERVSLSSQQAITGARLPLHVALPHTCTVCGGRGETWSDACSPCDGSGQASEHHPLVVTIPGIIGIRRSGVVLGLRHAFRNLA